MITSALALDALPFGQPLRELLPVCFGRLSHLMVIFLAENKQHDVGILFDRARFTQIGKLRAFVFAAFDLARQLRKREDRNV